MAAKAIAQAITEGFKLLKTVLDKSDARKTAKCKEAAEKYIQCNQREGVFKDFPDEKREKYLRHYAKRFFHYN